MPWGKTSGRTAPLPKGWTKNYKEPQLEADGYQCTHIREDTGRRCTETATDVHHIGDPNDHSKLTSLCSWHHNRITGLQGATSWRRVREARPKEKHPGLI